MHIEQLNPYHKKNSEKVKSFPKLLKGSVRHWHWPVLSCKITSGFLRMVHRGQCLEGRE